MAGRMLPCTVTRPTPETWLSRGLSSVSARSDNLSMERPVEVSAMVRIGGSDGFTFE